MLLKIRLRSPILRYIVLVGHRGYASQADHHHDTKIERKPDSYRPGSDSYAYENPWPKLNKGRLDWLFYDGWRRPLAKDQGAKMRREWISYGLNLVDEHKDWMKFHQAYFIIGTVLFAGFSVYIHLFRSDWPLAKEWSYREAHLEIARREKAGLPYISKDLIDPKRVALQLPSEEELRDFDIII